MKKGLLHSLLLAGGLLLGSMTASAAVSLTKQGGWFESAYAEWSPVSGATGYNVYVKGGQYSSYTKIDAELVRNYGSYLRADVVGLKAGSYTLKVVPVVSGSESSSDATETSAITVTAHDRSGFAHYKNTEGIGAYNDDGTLKSGAQVIYVYGNNAKTVSATIGGTKYTGFQDIVYGLQKGNSTTPIDIRIIGTIKDSDMDKFGSSSEGLQVKGKSTYAKLNLTIEGIGEDAAIWGFGMLIRNAGYVELRNFAVMLCMDDAVSMDTGNSYIWVHNMDFFYGNTGGDSDQAKGDGTVDVKGKSTNITVSYNHFFDTGKSSLGGMKSETTDCLLTYHHNWFDHSDSRHPRIRTMFFHIYNNYFDGCSKYGVGMTMGGSAFVENNYFRNTKYPMMISKQGTDAQGDGTFSGEAGGVIKAYGNTIKNAKRYVKWSSADSDDWDAYEADASTAVPSSVTCAAGGTGYNDKLSGTYSWTPDAADDVPAKVTGDLGAGRMGHGDFKWQFNNATQDENYGVITALKTELQNYKSSLVGFVDSSLPSSVNNGGYDGTSRSGGDAEKNENFTPSWGGSDGGSDDDDSKGETQAYLSDSFTTTMGGFYLFNTDNDATSTAKVVGKVVTLAGSSTSSTGAATSSKYNPTPNAQDTNKYGLELVKSTGSATFYCASGIPTIAFQLYRTGTFKSTVSYSEDGTTWTSVGNVTSKKGVQTLSFSTPGTVVDPDAEVLTYTYPKYVKIDNSATGSVYIQGVKIYTVKDGEDPITAEAVSDENNANATVTIDGTEATSKTFGADDDAATATVVVAPAIDGATVTAPENATAVEGQTNTWTVAVPEAGSKTTATFTVTAKDGTTTKTYTVTISKSSSVDPTPEPTPTPSGDATVVNFTGSTPSDASVAVSGSYTTKDGSVEYNGTTYTTGVKMESKTSITITPTKDCTVTLYFGGTGSKFKLDGTEVSKDSNGQYSFSATGNKTYTLTKKDTNVFLYLVVYTYPSGIDGISSDAAVKDTRMFDLMGRQIQAPQKGQIYIMGGKKYIGK